MPGTLQMFSSVGGDAFRIRLLEELAALGWHTEQVLSLTPGRYRSRRGPVSALARRWRMYPAFAAKIIRRCRSTGGGCTVRVVTTNPFFAPWLVLRCSSPRIPVVLLLYDLYPEAMEAAGHVRPGGRLSAMLARGTRHCLREAGAVVFLGRRLRDYVQGRYGSPRNGVVIPVGADGSAFRGSGPEPVPASAPVRCLYCGQFGRMHDVETLAGFFSDPDGGGQESGVLWTFHAHGAGYRLLRERISRSSGAHGVVWGGPMDDGEWTAAMRAAHVAVITLKPGAERVAMPSKVYSALVAGQAILAVCPKASDLADLVTAHDCGWVVEPGDLPGLVRAVRELRGDREELHRRRVRAFRAGHRHYDTGVLSAQWAELLDRVAAAHSGA